MTFGEQCDSTSLEVKYDPRVGMPQEVLEHKYMLLKSLERKMDVLEKAVKRLNESEKIVGVFKERIEKGAEKEKYEMLLKSHKAIRDTIDMLMDDLASNMIQIAATKLNELPNLLHKP